MGKRVGRIMNTGNRDLNEPEIMKVLDLAGIRYVQQKPGAGFDLLIMCSPMECWEVKNPTQRPDKQRLTDAELDTQEYCDHRHIKYRTIKTIDDAVWAVNKIKDREW